MSAQHTNVAMDVSKSGADDPALMLEKLEGLESGMKPSDIHVLLVDDEKVSRLVVAKQLTRAGYTVTLAENGEQALAFLNEHPDLPIVAFNVDHDRDKTLYPAFLRGNDLYDTDDIKKDRWCCAQ